MSLTHGSGLAEAMVEMTMKWSGNPMSSTWTLMTQGLAGEVIMRSGLPHRYMDVLEQDVVIQDLCEVMTNLAQHRSLAIKVSADVEASGN